MTVKDRGRTRKPRLVGGVKGRNINKLFLTGKPRPVGGELHYGQLLMDFVELKSERFPRFMRRG